MDGNGMPPTVNGGVVIPGLQQVLAMVVAAITASSDNGRSTLPTFLNIMKPSSLRINLT
jgi:hypothetical protein